MSSSKTVSLEALAEIAAELRQQGNKLVLCHGTFDLMHAGHIRHLQCAREEGDRLLVTLTADAYVNKGPERPVFPQELRSGSLAALDCVDYVAINDAEAAINVIELLKPSVYAKGGEYKNEADDVTGNITLEREAVERCGGNIFFTDEISFSSTELLNAFFGVFPDGTKEYLAEFRKRYQTEGLIERLRALSSLKVLVIGDTIVDEYCYTTPMGQSGKSNVLAVRYQDEECFAGGAVAVANHIAGFVGEVSLLSVLGSQESREEFLLSKIKSNVTPEFFIRDDDRTLVKRRFVDPDMTKLFEVYLQDGGELPSGVEKDVVDWIKIHGEKYDAIVTADFGNGFISEKIVEIICQQPTFLALNTQINAGNRCYHAVTRYPRADFVSLNEPELRLAMHNATGSLVDLAKGVAIKMGAKALAVTRGTKGVLLWDAVNEEVYEVPALSTRVIDRIGAGDAFLSLAGITQAQQEPAELSAFIGSVAAALEVQSVCNRDSVEPTQVFKYLKTLLK